MNGFEIFDEMFDDMIRELAENDSISLQEFELKVRAIEIRRQYLKLIFGLVD